MAIFGSLEEFFSEVIYPARYVLGPIAIIGLAALAFAAYRLGAFAWMARHRTSSLAVGLPLLVATLAGGYYLASPLWERSELIEASPLDAATATAIASTEPVTAVPTQVAATASPVPAATATPTEAAFSPRVVREGTWQGADDFHFARGRALLIETAPGVYTVRVEDFSVRNGPDLFVYLSPSATGYADGGLNLGSLKATDGAFNYDVPPGTDISQYESVVIWCQAFAVLFGTASFAAM